MREQDRSSDIYYSRGVADTADLTAGDNGLDYLARSKNVEDSETREAKVAPTLGEKMVKVFGDEVASWYL